MNVRMTLVVQSLSTEGAVVDGHLQSFLEAHCQELLIPLVYEDCLHLDPLMIVIVSQVDLTPMNVRQVDESGLYYNLCTKLAYVSS